MMMLNLGLDFLLKDVGATRVKQAESLLGYVDGAWRSIDQNVTTFNSLRRGVLSTPMNPVAGSPIEMPTLFIGLVIKMDSGKLSEEMKRSQMQNLGLRQNDD